MRLPWGRRMSQGAGGVLRDCPCPPPVPSWQGQGEDETLLYVPRRNQNYSDILRSLALGDKQLGAFDLTLRFTHLFWFGDLNYRLDMDMQVRPCRHRGWGQEYAGGSAGVATGVRGARAHRAFLPWCRTSLPI